MISASSGRTNSIISGAAPAKIDLPILAEAHAEILPSRATRSRLTSRNYRGRKDPPLHRYYEQGGGRTETWPSFGLPSFPRDQQQGTKELVGRPTSTGSSPKRWGQPARRPFIVEIVEIVEIVVIVTINYVTINYVTIREIKASRKLAIDYRNKGLIDNDRLRFRRTVEKNETRSCTVSANVHGRLANGVSRTL